MELGRSTAELMASSTLARNCFWASKAVPVPRIEVRVCPWAPRTAQTYVRILSLTLSTPAFVNPTDLSSIKLAQALSASWPCFMKSIHVCFHALSFLRNSCVWGRSALRLQPHILAHTRHGLHRSTQALDRGEHFSSASSQCVAKLRFRRISSRMPLNRSHFGGRPRHGLPAKDTPFLSVFGGLGNRHGT